MKQLRILNTRDVKRLQQLLGEQHGGAMPADVAFLQDYKNHIFLVTRDVMRVDLEQLRLNSLGLYVGEMNAYGELRLSIEGSQLLGVHATRNVRELDAEQVRAYFRGEEITLDPSQQPGGQPFLLLKYRNDFLGAAKCKGGKLLNYLPKVHRTHDLIL